MDETNKRKRAVQTKGANWNKHPSQKLAPLRLCVFRKYYANLCVCSCIYVGACVCLFERQVMAEVVDSCQCTWTQDGRRVLVSVNTLL